MNCILPYDIQWCIVQYITDIDIRRYYKIYSKISIKKFKFLDNIIRVPVSNSNSNHFIKFNFQNNYEDNFIRSTENIDKDMLYFNYNITNKNVDFELNIFKLKKNTFNSYNKDIFYKGSLQNTHHWQNIKIKYVIN